jgi:hypothetical protein
VSFAEVYSHESSDLDAIEINHAYSVCHINLRRDVQPKIVELVSLRHPDVMPRYAKSSSRLAVLQEGLVCK